MDSWTDSWQIVTRVYYKEQFLSFFPSHSSVSFEVLGIISYSSLHRPHQWSNPINEAPQCNPYIKTIKCLQPTVLGTIPELISFKQHGLNHTKNDSITFYQWTKCSNQVSFSILLLRQSQLLCYLLLAYFESWRDKTLNIMLLYYFIKECKSKDMERRNSSLHSVLFCTEYQHFRIRLATL